MMLAHKIRLDPTPSQLPYFAKAAGTARFAYNWALAEWQRQYKAEEKPSANKLKAKWNEVRRTEFPWSLETTKCAGSQAIMNLGKAFDNFFRDMKKPKGQRKAQYPQFKRKGQHDSFALWNDQFKAEGKRIRIPNLGWVKMREALRFTGKIMSATICRVADWWFVSIMVDTVVIPPARENQAASVGVDLGVSALATLSTGETIVGPKPLRALGKRMRRLNKSLSRKVKGSANFRKAKRKLGRLHYRIGCIRNDALHKLTTGLTRTYTRIGIEDLNVAGMVQNRSLARSISDQAFGEFRRQVEYKAIRDQSEIVVAHRFFPSSKTCSDCGHVMPKLPLKVREWVCPSCGTIHDRDKNAAINLDPNHAAGLAVKVCGAGSSGDGFAPVVKLPAVKQKPKSRTCAHV
jgi:putative transposase